MKYEKERCELIECARAMEHYGLVMLSGSRRPSGLRKTR